MTWQLASDLNGSSYLVMHDFQGFHYLSSNYVTIILFSTTLNGIDFKFVSRGLWSEKQNILRQHAHQKSFWILTIKCGHKLKHENEAEGPWPLLDPQPRFRVYAYHFHIY